jgi:hypothetical protein
MNHVGTAAFGCPAWAVVVQFEKSDSYQGFASAMPTKSIRS